MSHRLTSVLGLALAALVSTACQENATAPVVDGPETVLAAASTQSTQVFRQDVNILVFVPCLGEAALLEGVMHSSFHASSDGNGGFHTKFMFNPSGLSGSTPSGYAYSGTGNTQGHTNLTAGLTDTFVNNYRMIGKAGAPSLMIHENAHLTINANGEITAAFSNFRATCE